MGYLDKYQQDAMTEETVSNLSEYEHFDMPVKQSGVKPHIIRRSVEDYLAEKELNSKLTDVFDDDYPLD